ncbi:MAG: MFS transporter [Sphingomonas sp.]
MIRAWLVVLLCSVMIMMGAGPVYYAYGNYAAAFAREFNAPATIINLGFTAVGVIGNLGSAPVGMALDRWGIRAVSSVGVVGTALGMVLASMASGIWQVVILFGTLIAMADVCIGVVCTSYLVSHWFDRRRGLALGLSVLGASAAAIVFPPLTDLLIRQEGWRTTFVIYAAALLVLLPAIWLIARTPADFPPAERTGRPPRDSEAPVTLRQLFHHRGFWTLSFVTGVMTGVNTGTMVSLVTFAGTRGLTTGQGSLLLSVIGGLAMLGKIMIGFGIDRFSLILALRLGVACQFFGMVLLALAPGYAAMLAAVAIFGLGVGAMLPVWSAAVAGLFGLAGYSRALGWSRAVMTPISMAFPIMAGAIFDRTGSYGGTWTCFALLLGVAFAVLMTMPRIARPV